MHIGTPRTMRHAGAWTRNPELVDDEPTTNHDPVERIVIVDEAAIPDDPGELVAEFDVERVAP